MPFDILLNHILFAGILFFISFLICRHMVKKRCVLDTPNCRSSHKKATPTSGGVGIVISFLIGTIIIYFISDSAMIKEKYFWGMITSALLISGISFYDDISTKPFIHKLFFQAISVSTVMLFDIVLHEVTLPYIGPVKLGIWGYLFTFLWLLGLTNAYNFIDGLNGMAGGTAIIVGLFFGFITFKQGSHFVYIICYTIIAGTFGFWVFNFPYGKLFMGDVGSTFLGFIFACLAIIAAYYDHSHTSFFIMPLLLFNVIYDTFFTFLMRLFNGENVFHAHCRHLYQLMNKLGFSHVQVSLFHYTLSFSQGIGAWFMVHIEGNKRLFVFIPFLIFQIIYTLIILHKAKQANLIFPKKVEI